MGADNSDRQGVYQDVPVEQYHAGPGVSKSGLDLIARSPAHFHHAKQTPRQPSPQMRRGSLLHSLVLEPELFDMHFAIAPDVNRRTNAGKAVLEEFEAANPGKLIVRPEEHAEALLIQDAVFAHPAANSVLSAEGVVEQSVYWTDAETGVLCRCRPDFWREDGVIVDLKTSKDASHDGFSRAVATYRYHVQAAFYSDGVEAATGIAPKAFLFLAVETTAPYNVALYSLTDEAIELGRELYRRDLRVYAECERSGKWPGYSPRIEILDLPGWAYRKEEA